MFIRSVAYTSPLWSQVVLQNLVLKLQSKRVHYWAVALFMSTKHKLSTDMLLVEIVRRSPCSVNGGYNNANNGANPSNSGNNENIEDRECYSLCAGIALGLIHLGLGGQGVWNLENTSAYGLKLTVL
eukprot:432151_1